MHPVAPQMKVVFSAREHKREAVDGREHGRRRENSGPEISIRANSRVIVARQSPMATSRRSRSTKRSDLFDRLGMDLGPLVLYSFRYEPSGRVQVKDGALGLGGNRGRVAVSGPAERWFCSERRPRLRGGGPREGELVGGRVRLSRPSGAFDLENEFDIAARRVLIGTHLFVRVVDERPHLLRGEALGPLCACERRCRSRRPHCKKLAFDDVTEGLRKSFTRSASNSGPRAAARPSPGTTPR